MSGAERTGDALRPPANGVPDWLRTLVGAAPEAGLRELRPPRASESAGRASAVLILFGEGADGTDLLLIERAGTLRSHAGQAAFPGGGSDPEDGSPAATALREAVEEVGLDPAGVEVLATLPELWLAVTNYVVTPVLAWWHTPSPVGVVDTAEVADVVRVPVAELTDPANRFRTRHPSGYVGPAFDARGLLVWGFTAMVLDGLLELAGIARRWDHDDVRDLPDSQLTASPHDRPPANGSGGSPSAGVAPAPGDPGTVGSPEGRS